MMQDSPNPGIEELKRIIHDLKEEIKTLERRIERFDETISDDPRYGRIGLFTQIRLLREEHERLKNIVEGFERNEKERREELAGDLLRRGRAVNIMFGFISTVLSGFVLSAVSCSRSARSSA